MSHDLFERYKQDRTAQRYDRLVEEFRPLVYSVARRYLRDPNDVEDAVQETFLKLARRIEAVTGSLAGWLTTAAHSSCVDLIRRAVRQRRRREGLAVAGRGVLEHRAIHEQIHLKLHQALLELDSASRDLLIARFFRKEPVRSLAAQRKTSTATICRRVDTALQNLAAIFRDMGIESVDDTVLAAHFGETQIAGDRGEGLRFAPDWRELPSLNSTSAAIRPDRPIRVGTFLSYESAKVKLRHGMLNKMEHQVWSTQLITDPTFELVGIIQSSTSHLPPIERTLRDYGVVGGLIESTDSDAMRTLDVILLGVNFAITEIEAQAIVRAIRSGVGLLKELWVGAYHPTDLPDSPKMRELSLAMPPWGAYHTQPACGQSTTATVLEEHPLLPGLKTGDTFTITPACGPVYRISPGSQLLMTKGPVLSPDQHRVPGLGPMRLPAFIVGNLGEGRVVVSNIFSQFELAAHLSVSPQEYLLRLLRWLAQPGRRELR
jgi:RNA polymerase sigma-70 factor (ECF subfamily)